MRKIICIMMFTMMIFFTGCGAGEDKESNLTSEEIKIINTKYSSLNEEQRRKILTISEHMNLHDWNKYGDKLKQIYIDESVYNLAKAGSKNQDADKKIGEDIYEDTKAKAIRKLEGKETEQDKKEVTNTATTETKVALTDNAIKLTTDTLKRDTLVRDVAIVMSDDKKTIIVAIQVNAATNKDKAKDLIDTAVRQLGTFCNGKTPTKTYLGEVWENYDGNIRVFSGDKNVIQDAYITKTTHKIRYSSN